MGERQLLDQLQAYPRPTLPGTLRCAWSEAVWLHGPQVLRQRSSLRPLARSDLSANTSPPQLPQLEPSLEGVGGGEIAGGSEMRAGGIPG